MEATSQLRCETDGFANHACCTAAATWSASGSSAGRSFRCASPDAQRHRLIGMKSLERCEHTRPIRKSARAARSRILTIAASLPARPAEAFCTMRR